MHILSLKPFMKIHLSCFSDSRIYSVYFLECAARYELHVVKILNTMLPPMRFVEQFKQCRQTDRCNFTCVSINSSYRLQITHYPQ